MAWNLPVISGIPGKMDDVVPDRTTQTGYLIAKIINPNANLPPEPVTQEKPGYI